MATINGTAGNDNLQGTSGDDAINGAGGIDTIDAGAGDDIVKIIRGGSYAHWVYNNLIDGGTGYDVLDLNGWDKPLDVFCTNTDEINVDLYDVAKKEQIWRGAASKTLGSGKDPQKVQKNLNKAMAKLFKKYPPPAKA